MKLLTPFAAMVAAATAGQIYNNQPAESYSNAAEIYQQALEYQQQGLYSDQSQGYSAGADQSHELPSQEGHEIAYSGSRPAGEKTARILSHKSESDGHNYQYAYETENGIKAQEAGSISGHDSGTDAHGSYSYTGDDGKVYTVTYTADANGFHAQGEHLPTSPPIPEAIAKSLEQNAKDEANGIYDDGKYSEKSQQVVHQESDLSDHQQLGYQLANQLSSHQLSGYQQSGHQLSAPVLSSHQLAGEEISGHQLSSGHQLVGVQVPRHQQVVQLSGHQHGAPQYSGHQMSGAQLSGHQLFVPQMPSHQLSGHNLAGHQSAGTVGHQAGQQNAQSYNYESTAFQAEDAFHPGYYRKH